jgi:predicted secreted protein
VVNKINLLHKPLLRYQYFNDSIKNKKWHFFDFEITTCKTTRKRQKEGQFTTPVPVEPQKCQIIFDRALTFDLSLNSINTIVRFI